MAREKLPRGFSRRASGSLRVQIRLKGHEEIVRNFPLSDGAPEARKRQLAEAAAWAEETRRKLLSGVHISTREAERTTLREALQRYEIESLKGRKASNVANEGYRIKTILADPIADRMIAQLRKTDIAAFRDRLIYAGWLKNVEKAAAKVQAQNPGSSNRKRSREIALLPGWRKELHESTNVESRRELEQKIGVVCEREGIREPAKTTISNVVQLITRALKHASDTMEGVPDISGVAMPKASKGRERRVSDEELRKLLEYGERIDPRLPLIIRFAVATALRRERLLTCRHSYIRRIGGGKRAIAFPRESDVRTKRTGVIPVTLEIVEIIEAAGAIDGGRMNRADDLPIFDIHLEAFKSQWRRLLIATEIKDLHFHDLRHEATSRLFERGLTTAEVMSITGHSTTDMVDRYSHYSAGLVLEKLERGLGPETVLDEIRFLADQFRAMGGDMLKLKQILQPKTC